MSFSAEINYYELLDVEESVNQDEIERAYAGMRKLFSERDPRINRLFSEREAEQMLLLLEEAYTVLGNSHVRAVYDRERAMNARKQKETQVKKVQEELEDLTEYDPIDPSQIKDFSGPVLRQIREAQGLSLESLGEVTRVNPFYIRAIEEMETFNLPASVFVRGYVVQIAKVLGLETKTVADSYMRLFKAQSQEHGHSL